MIKSLETVSFLEIYLTIWEFFINNFTRKSNSSHLRGCLRLFIKLDFLDFCFFLKAKSLKRCLTILKILLDKLFGRKRKKSCFRNQELLTFDFLVFAPLNVNLNTLNFFKSKIEKSFYQKTLFTLKTITNTP